MTAVHPPARAGASERIPRATGEFQGAMIPATPTGWRSTMLISPSLTTLAVPTSVRASAALNRSVSGANATSSAPWSWTLPFSSPRISTSSPARSSNRSAILVSTRALSCRSVRHAVDSNALLADATARSASSRVPSAYAPMVCPVAGSTEPWCSLESAHAPSIQCRATVRVDVVVILLRPGTFHGMH